MGSLKKAKRLNLNGFTLIELLVVVGLLVTVGLIVVHLFLSNLRSSTKTRALTEIKQNGEYTLSVMTRMIRNSREIQINQAGQTCQSNMASLKILNPDGGTTEFMCGNQIASKSGVLSPTFLTSSNLLAKDCLFNCQPNPGKPEVIIIKFTLAQEGASLGQEFKAEVPFQITVSTRTY